MRRIRVRYQWFDSKFEIHDNLLLDILKASDFDATVVRDSSSKCEIEFVGTHKPLSTKLKDKVRLPTVERKTEFLIQKTNLPCDYYLYTSNFGRRIWYTSENLRPPSQEGFDGSLSFDQDNFRGFNAYCPSWYQDVGVAKPRFSKVLGTESILTLLKVGRRLTGAQSSDIGVVANNSNPLISFVQQELSKTFKTYLLPRPTNKELYQVPQTIRKFKYIVCSEVDFYPGYVTSILFEAYLAGAVPIYLGDIGSDQNINRHAFICLKDFAKVSDLVSYISNLDSKTYSELYEQPLLLREPSLSRIIEVTLG